MVLTVEINNENRDKVQETITSSDKMSSEEVEKKQQTDQLMLVSVSLKEAALDSPSFRASIHHAHNQITSVEVWMAAMESSMTKVVKLVGDLEIYLRSFLEYLVPLFLLDGILDPEYTNASLSMTERGLQEMIEISMGLLHFNMSQFTACKDLILERIAVYKTVKRKFDSAQSNYDRGLSLYMGTTKQKDPKLFMEDSIQLYSVRREYLSRSLDMAIELDNVGDYVNARLIRLCLFTWKQKMLHFNGNPLVRQLFTAITEELRRISCWSDHYRAAVNRMRSDMKAARNQVEVTAAASFAPSRKLGDYMMPVINSRMLAECSEEAVEKHGYLFMKTHIDKSSKPFWVKRWAFIQGGFFSLLELSPTFTAVQETDKIGLLLCSVKYTPNEERRLCFELKTIDTTLVFQTETVADLKLWLKVFENAHHRITQEHDVMSNVFDLASRRFPPLITEFASSVNTATDKQLTNAHITDKEGNVIASSKLSSHIMRDDNLFTRYIFNEVIKIKLPLLTESTRSAVVAYSLSGATAAPTALSANIWGSINWGYHHIQEEESNVYADEAPVPVEEFTKQIGNGIMVPENFPNKLLAQEIQLRALFESEIGLNECCLLSFKCLWSPHSKQELRGVIFVTQTHCYSYLAALGFVTLTKIGLENLVECVCIPKEDHDVLKVYKIRGTFQAKLFLDDGELVARKFNHLIRNVASNEPKGVNALILELQQIDGTYDQEREDAKHILAPKYRYAEDSAESFVFGTAEIGKHLPSAEHDDKMNFIGTHSVKLPPKVILHMLFGAHSSVLDLLHPIALMKKHEAGPWMKIPDSESGLFRDVLVTVWFHNGRSEGLKVRQEIEEMRDNEYYSIRMTTSKINVKFFSQFSTSLRIVVVGVEDDKSKIYYYNRTNIHQKSLLNPLLRHLSATYTQYLNQSLNRAFDKEARSIGSKGKIIKSIFKHGKIPITKETYTVPDQPPATITLDTIFLLLLKGWVGQMLRAIWALILYVLRSAKTFLTKLTMHKFLVFVIICLSAFNAILLRTSTTSFWQDREAKNLVKELVGAEPMFMERAVYLEDVKEMVRQNMFHNTTSECFATFKNESFVLNYDQATAWKLHYHDRLNRDSMVNMKKALKQIGIRRNEMLVNINILNQLEEDIAKGEWKNWLRNELDKCEYILGIAVSDKVVNETNGLDAGIQQILSFCDCCSHEMALLDD